LISCKKDVIEPKPDLTLKTIKLSDSNLELLLGASHTLTTTLTPSNATSATLAWSSSDATIVTVDQTGKLEAIKVGETTITVKNSDGTVSSNCKVVVKPISANQIVLDKTSLTMIIGTKDKLNVRFVPTNTTNQKITWTTSNPLIVKVDHEGNIEASATGDAIIMATTEDGKTTAECKILVSLPSITGLDIDKKNIQVLIGEDVQFKAVTTPPNAQPEEMIWSSSDNSVATISSSGIAKTLKPGKTTIKVTNKSGLVSATTELTVLAIKVQSIQLNNSIINLTKGAKSKISYTVLPANATDKAVTFSIANKEIASIDASGTVTAIADGETIVTISSNDGAANSKITIKVTPVKVTSINLSKTQLQLLLGESETITTNIFPLNAENKDVSWKSSNPLVVTVDKTGKINPIALGNAIITATTTDGGFTANCNVEISTIDKFIKIAAKPNGIMSSSSSGNSAKLSIGIYNPTSMGIKIKFVKLFVNNILSKNYTVDDPDLSSQFYIYELGPFVLNSGAIDMSTLMLGWTVRFEYEYQGVMYQNTVAVKRNVIGQVNFNDFFDASNQSMMRKSNELNLRKSSSIKLL